VAREALVNALWHSHATRLTVSLGIDVGGDDSLVISDNGVGFDVAAIDPVAQSHGFSRMRREAESVGGHLFITTSAGDGTTVCLRMPNLQPEQDARMAGRRTTGANIARAAKVIRTLVAAGQPVFRDGLAELLGHEADIRVVGRSSTVPETIAQARRLVPDVVLAGAGLVRATDSNLVSRLQDLARPPKVLLLSEGCGDDRVAAAMAAGAQGYLTVKVSLAAVIDAVRAVHRGASIVDGAAAHALWHRPPLPPLSGRDVEIVRRVAAGETNAEIARTANVSEKTIEAALGVLLRKLSARNRAHLVSRALELKILEGKP
jgi:DNA-binding NarL/FixJ family response regulator